MYLSPTDIQHTRAATIDNLHVASRAWVEATEKLADLTLRAGRQALDEGSKHLQALADSKGLYTAGPVPLERIAEWRSDSAVLVREYFEIIGEAHQAVLQMAREQVVVLDQAFMKQMDRASRSADANGEAAIDHMKSAVRQAEAGFNELTDAAAHGADLVEDQVRQISDALGAEPEDATEVAPASRSRRTRSN
jgi:hypothetical protein